MEVVPTSMQLFSEKAILGNIHFIGSAFLCVHWSDVYNKNVTGWDNNVLILLTYVTDQVGEN